MKRAKRKSSKTVPGYAGYCNGEQFEAALVALESARGVLNIVTEHTDADDDNGIAIGVARNLVREAEALLMGNKPAAEASHHG